MVTYGTISSINVIRKIKIPVVRRPNIFEEARTFCHHKIKVLRRAFSLYSPVILNRINPFSIVTIILKQL